MEAEVSDLRTRVEILGMFPHQVSLGVSWGDHSEEPSLTV